MADNKTKPTNLNVQAFLNACTDEVRRTDAKTLAELMRKVTGQEPAMWGPSIVGFDSYHYRYESGREGDMPIIGFSPRKAANVLYGTLGVEGADALLLRLGRHTTGKGCLYIKKLADVDVTVLENSSETPLERRGSNDRNIPDGVARRVKAKAAERITVPSD